MVEGTMRLLQLGTMTGLRCTTIRGRQIGLLTKATGLHSATLLQPKPTGGLLMDGA